MSCKFFSWKCLKIIWNTWFQLNFGDKLFKKALSCNHECDISWPIKARPDFSWGISCLGFEIKAEKARYWYEGTFKTLLASVTNLLPRTKIFTHQVCNIQCAKLTLLLRVICDPKRNTMTVLIYNIAKIIYFLVIISWSWKNSLI